MLIVFNFVDCLLQKEKTIVDRHDYDLCGICSRSVKSNGHSYGAVISGLRDDRKIVEVTALSMENKQIF